jgi:hypothetical protein
LLILFDLDGKHLEKAESQPRAQIRAMAGKLAECATPRLGRNSRKATSFLFLAKHF